MIKLDAHLKSKYLNANIYYVIQPSIKKEMLQSIDGCKTIVMKYDMFEYNLFRKDYDTVRVIKSTNFSELYIPSSREQHYDLDVLRIANFLKFKTFIHFNILGNEIEEEVDKEELFYAAVLSSNWFYNIVFLIEKIVRFKNLLKSVLTNS